MDLERDYEDEGQANRACDENPCLVFQRAKGRNRESGYNEQSEDDILGEK